MKKFFFFKSSSNNANDDNSVSPQPTKKKIQDTQSCTTSPTLRRSHSMSSSTVFLGDVLAQKDVSPQQQRNHSSRHRALTPERHHRQKGLDFVHINQATERPGDVSSQNSSFNCSNTSNNVLDLYIDGEQLQEKVRSKNKAHKRNNIADRMVKDRLPPRVHNITSGSSIDSVEDNKPRTYSFREFNRSRDWVENGFVNESPRKLAKNVIKRLSETHGIPKSKSTEFDRGAPITIEDIYGGSSNTHPDVNSEYQNYSLDEKTEDDIDVELKRRSKEAEERFIFFSEELEQERFLLDCGPSLIQNVRNLSEQRVSLAHEISSLVHSRISERACAKEELKSVKLELDSRTRRLEKEKNELQSALEKELDRRSNDWSFKLEKYQLEEQRLRDRVRELAEQNVSLQRELSSFNERESEFQHLTTRVAQLSEENKILAENLENMQENKKSIEQDFNCLKRNFEEKDKECKDLRKSISRLSRTCNDQEKTIAGLREGISEEICKKQQPMEKFDKYVAKIQMEQIRLTGIEHALRRELDSCRFEVDSLRNENINLLNRLKANGNESAVLTFKLDNELSTRICCLQNQGLSMLNESREMCSKLLEFIKGKAGQGAKQGLDFVKNGLDGQFIIESDMKVQSFKRGTESLTRSLQTLSDMLHDKSNLVNMNCSPSGFTQEEIMRVELETERLLTKLLTEKLFSKELEVELLQAELSSVVRGNDILRSEVQNLQDELSCVSHHLKELELQTMKKDENISRLETNLHENMKELSIINGILPKVSDERDLMWEEVKKYSEMNMLLNAEVEMLKKKVDTLDEDVLLKEGQITILKDTLGKRPFDLFASPDSKQAFLLE
ncbi:hypothetical protein ACFE04_005807 [Oxalis oulophora]